MERYEAYKDSGIAWLGEIPAHWEVKKVKYIFNFHDNQRIPISSEERGKMLIKKYSYYGASGVIDKVDNYIFDGEYILFGEDGANILDRNTPLAFKASGRFWVNNHAHILTPKIGNIDYCINALECADYEYIVSGSAQPKITSEALGQFLTISPPIEEQKTIALYLDRKTAEIDQLIAQKQKLIALYEEEKTALINHAVTRGINPNVKLKPSGIAWLGDIPENWELQRLKFLAQIQTGLTLGKIYKNRTLETFPYLRVANVQDGFLDLEKITTISLPDEEASKYRLLNKDILMTEGGDFDKLGRGYIWEEQIENCLHQNHIFVVRTDKSKINPIFLSVFLKTDVCKSYFVKNANQTTNLATTNKTTLSSLNLLIPPLEEQKAIVEYIETETARIDAKIAKTKRIIELQNEYRTALISEAVTGKIKVLELDMMEMTS